ncbi:MAG: hypothetical protein IPN70_01950 [Candidatus Moraniibacteriota bacterium]|nr:MAG: hypothetical protein IPN70_01950 [Candidatus Moranbacteria bacterium]
MKSNIFSIVCLDIALAFFISFGIFVFDAKADENILITAEDVLKSVNESRIFYNTQVLSFDEELNKAAEMKATDMFERQYFSHDTPTGEDPWYWIERAGYEYRYAGENLAIHFKNADSQHKAWMESPLHKKNILNEQYHDTGIAVREGLFEGVNTIITVQLFGTRRNEVVSGVSASYKKEEQNIHETGKEISDAENTFLIEEKNIQNEQKYSFFHQIQYENFLLIFIVSFVFFPLFLVGGSSLEHSFFILRQKKLGIFKALV